MIMQFHNKVLFSNIVMVNGHCTVFLGLTYLITMNAIMWRIIFFFFFCLLFLHFWIGNYSGRDLPSSFEWYIFIFLAYASTCSGRDNNTTIMQLQNQERMVDCCCLLALLKLISLVPISWCDWIIFLLPFSRLLYPSNVADKLTASCFLFWHISASCFVPFWFYII